MVERRRRPIGRPRLNYTSVQFNVRVHPDIRSLANAAAAREGISPSLYLTRLIAEANGRTDLAALIVESHRPLGSTDQEGEVLPASA